MLKAIVDIGRVLFLIPLMFAFVPHVYAAETVMVGLNVPLSGSYSRQGEDQLKAYTLAIDVLNDRGGILGKRIVYAVRDTETDPDVARTNAYELIAQGAQLITGGSSSAVAIAQAEVCQEKKILFLAGLSHSNETTGSHGHRYSFRWYNNGHQTAKAMSSVLVEKYGKKATYAFLYSDYTWGTTFHESLEEVIRKNGGKTVLSLPTKLGEKSYISALLKVKNAQPDVLVMIHFGDDMINSLRQATLLKLREKMAIVVPLMELHMAQPLGPEIMEGVITSMCWYHRLADRFEGSREFVRLFAERYHKKPGNAAAAAWVNMFQYAEAVERAGSFAGNAVIKTLEGHHFTLLGADEYWRDWDHQGIHPTYIAVGKSPAESKDEWDLFTLIDERDGEFLARTREENPVNLEPLE
jgi:ABC-type branched-subunit amino acid transport system substrate-binding protein